ncbi:exopolyphosphatase [Actinoplanes sp. ATCC 53533]|uniref:acyclic terpene utilization AtuA family protein n=1 Tax=Actinoplanes sp. ATCC 53533 TaxID=1288362 RepID=UPI000F793BCC|nr:acyclic terpene utilization AtuA family protein [Actinoplanes sp. ATCC 53533]RSM46853.1 exopolyphosphatase [Actinoplanes sp. ATCC 53533]
MSRTTDPETLRVGNCSGFYGDRLAAMREMLTGGELDVLTGDYLAELTMLILGRDRIADPAAGYARTFLAQLRDCLRIALDRGVRIVTNAGGANPGGLVAAIRELSPEPRIALVHGDDLTARAGTLGLGSPLGAHAYLGAFGIARALAAGADIVVTGRVTDASLLIGPAIAHFGWGRTDFDALAGATVAGHVIECGTQATGGNYPFFTEIDDLLRPGFPVAEIRRDGSSVITKHPGTGGAVTVGTVTAQLVYEVDDARYAGPDVTTRLDTVSLRQAGPDRVEITGVRGEPPPPDVKVACTAIGGYRNEMTVVLTGLDIEAKAELFRRQFTAARGTEPAEVTWSLARLDTPDAPTQQQASALLTVVARDPDEKVAGRAFAAAAVEVALASYPGFFATAPPGRAHPYGVFTAGYVPQAVPTHEVVFHDGTTERIDPPPLTRPLAPLPGPEAAPRGPGPTRRLPLGTIAGARSGDKGGDANVGLWVREDAAYPWLAALITEDTVRDLLPEAAALPVRVTRLPAIRAVNVVIEGLLGQGVAYHARFDPQAKGLGEWLRSRHVEIPEALLAKADNVEIPEALLDKADNVEIPEALLDKADKEER